MRAACTWALVRAARGGDDNPPFPPLPTTPSSPLTEDIFARAEKNSPADNATDRVLEVSCAERCWVLLC